jgi:hypothetical protein
LISQNPICKRNLVHTDRRNSDNYSEAHSMSSLVTEEFVCTLEQALRQTEQTLTWLQKLQRAIVESRGKAHDVPLPIALQSATSTEGLNPSGDESTVEGTGNQEETLATGTAATGTATKRKYRRHPKVSITPSTCCTEFSLMKISDIL